MVHPQSASDTERASVNVGNGHRVREPRRGHSRDGRDTRNRRASGSFITFLLLLLVILLVAATLMLRGGYQRTTREVVGERILFHRFPNEDTNNGNNLFGWASTVGLAELHGMKPCISMMGVGENLHDSMEMEGGECKEREGLFERLQNRWFPNAERSQNEAGYAVYQDFAIPSTASRFTVTGYLQSFR
jgi:hypothetical protein